MKLFSGLLVFILFFVLTVGVYFYCFAESEFFLNPLIDTNLPPGFTMNKFKQIKPGMTKSEVLKIIPPPMEIYKNSWYYGSDGAAPFGDFAWYRFEIEFDQQGKVTKTNTQIFHD